MYCFPFPRWLVAQPLCVQYSMPQIYLCSYRGPTFRKTFLQIGHPVNCMEPSTWEPSLLLISWMKHGIHSTPASHPTHWKKVRGNSWQTQHVLGMWSGSVLVTATTLCFSTIFATPHVMLVKSRVKSCMLLVRIACSWLVKTKSSLSKTPDGFPIWGCCCATSSTATARALPVRSISSVAWSSTLGGKTGKYFCSGAGRTSLSWQKMETY